MTVPPDQLVAMEPLAAVLFGIAVLHTFSVKMINRLATRFPEGSVAENFCHFLGEVEVVFGLWAAVLVGVWAARFGTEPAVAYVESVNFTEAGFVFVVMAMAATKPVLHLAERLTQAGAALIPGPRGRALYAATLVVGPLLGSFITEPAAMTVTALLLRDQVFKRPVSMQLKYATLGLLFVNVSVGGTLTHFAAPPVVMVVKAWGWTTPHMLAHFGWKAALAVVLGTVATTVVFRRMLATLDAGPTEPSSRHAPVWLAAVHVGFLALAVVNSHHLTFVLALFLFFLGWCQVTREHQDGVRIRESLLVGFFLGGLVTLGQLQAWWLKPLLEGAAPTPLFWGATALTAITDNAALTYLGTLVPSLDSAARYALVAGAVAGGGLTVIANAPNPAGYGILSPTFGPEGISPARLALGALPATLLASLAFLLL